jgi:DNA-binding transcriptional ArsR family regulator
VRRFRHPDLKEIELADIMYALSDPTRLEIVRMLSDGRPRTCGELNGNRPKSSMSHHFKILRGAGVIETQVEGKEHLNSLRTRDLEKRFPRLLPTILKAL